MTAAARAGALHRDLAGLVGAGAVLAEPPAHYLEDGTVARGVRGTADAVVLPADAQEVASVVAWCYRHEVAIVARGGGTGFAGGAVPDGGIVLALERLRGVRALDAARWRLHVEAGVTTADVRRLARESGLLFPPDPGAAEQSQIGGNVATNAGGPHAFRYGVTGHWVTGLEAVLAPGQLVTLGGPVRKDVAGYDLRGLLVGSEGTLGIVTAAWLRLVPAPEAAFPVAAVYADAADGCRAVGDVVESGVQAAALEYLDARTMALAGRTFPASLPPDGGFLVLAEADGSAAEAGRVATELGDVLGPRAIALHAPRDPAQVAALWRWREGVSHALTAERGGRVAEDVAVPLEHLRAAIEGTLAIGRTHGVDACSFGHAGDGNLHSCFLFRPDDADERARAEAALDEVAALALRLGGTVSGEHGVGLLKRAHAAAQLGPSVTALQRAVKDALDPRGLFNPGKKLPGETSPTG